MYNYKYVARNIKGKVVKGQRIAAGKEELLFFLKNKGLYLVNCSEDEKLNKFPRMSAKRISDFNFQLGMMLSSGITLTGAIEVMLRRDLKKKDRGIYSAIYDKLLAGVSLSEAAESLGEAFPPMLISMYRAGEANGTLNTTCVKMAEHYMKEFKITAKIKSAMTYPAILFCLLIIVMIAIFNFILPTFLSVYGDIELPAITKAVIFVSRLFTDYWLFTLIGFLSIVLLISLLRTNTRVRRHIDKIKLRLPVIGRLMKTIYTARFSRTLSSLYSTGITVLNALEICRGTIGNEYIARQFDEMISEIRNGNTLSEAVKKIDGYDAKLSSTIFIGEETGRLDAMLNSVADSFDYESEEAINKLTAFVEPVMIVFMAVLVGMVMIAVMMPIFGLYNSIDASM